MDLVARKHWLNPRDEAASLRIAQVDVLHTRLCKLLRQYLLHGVCPTRSWLSSLPAPP
jgi:hypothetical protein